MDFKKSKAPVNTVTRNIMDLCDDTHNIYEIFIGAIQPRHLHQWFTIAKFNIPELYDTA